MPQRESKPAASAAVATSTIAVTSAKWPSWGRPSPIFMGCSVLGGRRARWSVVTGTSRHDPLTVRLTAAGWPGDAADSAPQAQWQPGGAQPAHGQLPTGADTDRAGHVR